MPLLFCAKSNQAAEQMQVVVTQRYPNPTGAVYSIGAGPTKLEPVPGPA